MNPFSYEALKDDPKFKRFCARSIKPCEKPKPKRFKVPIPKPKSIWSVQGEYTTGRVLKIKHHSVPYFKQSVGGSYFVGEGWERTEVETGKLVKKGNEFVTELPSHEGLEVEVMRDEPNYDWPPKNWAPAGPALPEGEGRWRRALFSSQCICGVTVEANSKGFYFKESKKMLCESCGRRAAGKVRAA